MNDIGLVDEARVNLGIAKANLNLGKFRVIVRHVLQDSDEEHGQSAGVEGEEKLS